MSKLPQLPKGILREKKVTCKPMSTPAIKHAAVFNMAIGTLKVRKFNDVVAKAVTITKEKKQLNRMRKVLTKVDKEIDYMSLIITISEEIGLTKDVSDDMYELALRMIEDIQ